MELLRREKGPSLGHMVAYYGSNEVCSSVGFSWCGQKRWYSVWACSWHEHLRLHVQNLHPRVWSCKSNNGESRTRSGFAAKKVRIRTWLWPSYDLELHSSQPSVFTLYPWGRCMRIMDIRGGEGQFLSRTLKLPGCEHVNADLFDFPDVIERAKKFLAKEGIPDNPQ